MHARALGALAGACCLALPALANADYPHLVSRGETLTSVAAQDGLTVAALAGANGLSTNANLIAGTVLRIPPQGSQETAPATSTGTDSAASPSVAESGDTGSGGGYLVRPGDTLSAIAARARTTVGELAAANGLNPRGVLLAGTTLTLPGGSGGSDAGTTELVSTGTGGDGSAGDTSAGGTSAGGTSAGGTSAGGSSGGGYLVRPGDTLSGIAARAGTTVGELAAANGLRPSGVLLAGTTLTLPGRSSGAAEMGSTSTATSSVDSVPTTTGSGGPPFPTDQVVSASEIASIADAEGVPPSLAEAIAWQESGFNNSVISSAGAVGVMQIVPDTWRWIGDHLATTPLQPASASDNVRAGVLLLHALLAETGSDSETAAGYYQGLASIRRNGTYQSTQRYIASVLALVSRFGG